MKKLMALFLAITLVMTACLAISYVSLAEGEAPSGNIVFTLNNTGWKVAEGLTMGNKGTKLHTDVNKTVWDASGGVDFSGMTVIQTTYADGADATCIASSQTTWASVTIDNSAEIYVASIYNPVNNHMKWLTTQKYEKVTDADGNQLKVYLSDGKKYVLHKKTFLISDGETARVDFGNVGPDGNSRMYILFVNWIENPKPEVTDTLTDENGRTVKITKNPNYWSLSDKVVSGEDFIFNGKNPDFKIASVNGVDLAGAVSVQPVYSDASDPVCSGKSKVVWASAEINNSAEVYVTSMYGLQDVYMGWFKSAGYQEVTGASIKTTRDTNNTYKVYKKTYLIKDGETATVDFGNLGPYGGEYMYFAAIRWIDNPVGVEIKETLSQRPENYSVKYNWQIKDSTFSGGERFVEDFNGTGLEGATLVKTSYLDRDDVANNIMYPTAENEYVTVDWLTLTIDKTANVYVLANALTSPGSKYMQWLNKWNIMTDENGNAKYVITQTGSGTENFYVYYKTFIVPEGETVDVVLNNIGFYGNRMYFAAAKPTEAYAVNVTAEGKGEVSHTGAVAVEKNGALELTATPDAGYFIKSVTVDGEVLFENINEEKTFSITADKEKNVSVVFDALEIPEKLSTSDKIFNVNDGRVSGIVFASAPKYFGENIRVEFGMLFSKSQPSIWAVDGEGILKAMGRINPAASGNFGVRFFGNGIKAGETYYAMPYAIYQGAEGETVVYGTELNFIPAE